MTLEEYRIKMREMGIERGMLESCIISRKDNNGMLIFNAFKSGKYTSIRNACRETGVSKTTGRKYYKIFKSEHGAALCPCGKELTHRGWCSERFKKSPSRKSFMQEWHNK